MKEKKEKSRTSGLRARCFLWSHLSVCPRVPGTQRVSGIVSGNMFLRRFLDLPCPGSLHAVGRHQDPGVPQRVVTQVLVLWGGQQRRCMTQQHMFTTSTCWHVGRSSNLKLTSPDPTGKCVFFKGNRLKAKPAAAKTDFDFFLSTAGMHRTIRPPQNPRSISVFEIFCCHMK